MKDLSYLSIYDTPRVCVFDYETTYGEYLKRVGSPFSSGEIRLCASYFQFTHDEDVSGYFVKDGAGVDYGSDECLAMFPDLSNVDILVGHNMKFDLLWSWRHPSLEAFLKRGGIIWDTMYAAYLLSGMLLNLKRPENLRPSLSNVAKIMGCTRKLDVVAAMWAEGVRTEDIQEQVLMEYVQGDCQSTLEIFQEQVEKARRQHQLHMIHWRMDGLLATTEMEFNGMYVDKELGEEHLKELKLEEEQRDKALQAYIDAENIPDEMEFSWNSAKHLSALIFGGTVKYKSSEVVLDDAGKQVYFLKDAIEGVLDADGNPVRYKSGKNAGALKTRKVKVPDIERGPKTRRADATFTFNGYIKGRPEWRTASSRDELNDDMVQYQTGAAVLDEVAALGVPIVEDLSALRALRKDIGTYYKKFNESGQHKGTWTGMLTLAGEDGIVHHNLNHTVTVTARLSSNSPNLQNLSGKGKSKVKALFKSRFGEDGLMAEADYSQLENICKAVLSGDAAYGQAIRDGKDFHCDWVYLSPAGEGKTYDDIVHLCKVAKDQKWVEKRKNIKSLNFAEAYGAGISKLAAASGMSAEEVKATIAKRRVQYPDMYSFDDENVKKVEASRKLSVLKTKQGQTAGVGYIRNCTDTILHFSEVDAPDWLQQQGTPTAFSLPDIKNYPSQSLGGEVTQVAIGRLFRYIIENDRLGDLCLLVNTVHDSIWIDVHKSAVGHLRAFRDIMEDTAPFFNKHYPNVAWDMPFPADTDIGFSMLKMIGYDEYIQDNSVINKLKE
jgi:DNA polymerase I